MMYRQRLMKESGEAARYKDPTMLLIPKENDILLWTAYLFGPEDSPYKKGIFKIRISIPTTYPLNPPVLHFQTRIFHPNIHFETGEVCLEVLKNEWNPQWTIESVIRAVGVMLISPNADSPFNCDAGNLIRLKDKVGYDSLAEYYTEHYSISKQEFTLLTQEEIKDVNVKKNQ